MTTPQSKYTDTAVNPRAIGDIVTLRWRGHQHDGKRGSIVFASSVVPFSCGVRFDDGAVLYGVQPQALIVEDKEASDG